MTEGVVGPAGTLGIFEVTGEGLGTSVGGVGGAIVSKGGSPLDIDSVGAGTTVNGSGKGGGGEEGIGGKPAESAGKPNPSVPVLLRGWLVSLFMYKQAYIHYK